MSNRLFSWLFRTRLFRSFLYFEHICQSRGLNTRTYIELQTPVAERAGECLTTLMSQPWPHQQLSLTLKSQPVREKPAARNIWDTLRATGLQIPDDLWFKDFCSADREVAVSGTLTDTAIVQAVSAAMMQVPAHQLISETTMPPTVIQMRRLNRMPAGLSGRRLTP